MHFSLPQRVLWSRWALLIRLCLFSHELRTPLSGILGFIELLLLDDRLSHDQRSTVMHMRGSATGLLSILNDILDLGKVGIKMMNVDVLYRKFVFRGSLELCFPLALFVHFARLNIYTTISIYSTKKQRKNRN